MSASPFSQTLNSMTDTKLPGLSKQYTDFAAHQDGVLISAEQGTDLHRESESYLGESILCMPKAV